MRLIDADALKQDLLKRGFYPAIVKCALEAAPTIEQPTWISVTDRERLNELLAECETPKNEMEAKEE